MTTCKARIKYVALLNVLFYKWLGYPAGISGWHCAAVTTTISPTHACLSMGASPQKSNVRCYPSPLIEKGPACATSGARRPGFCAGDGKTPLLSSLHFRACHDRTMTTILLSLYTFYIQPRGRSGANHESEDDWRAKQEPFTKQWLYNIMYYTVVAVDLWVMHKNELKTVYDQLNQQPFLPRLKFWRRNSNSEFEYLKYWRWKYKIRTHLLFP